MITSLEGRGQQRQQGAECESPPPTGEHARLLGRRCRQTGIFSPHRPTSNLRSHLRDAPFSNWRRPPLQAQQAKGPGATRQGSSVISEARELHKIKGVNKSTFSSSVYVHVCAYAHKYMSNVYMYACGSQGTTLLSFLQHHPPCFLRQGLSLELTE